MTLNQREQVIAWVLGGVLALGAVYYLGSLWWDGRANLDRLIRDRKAQLVKDQKTKDEAARDAAEMATWRIQEINLSRPNPSPTDSLVRDAYYAAGNSSGVTITAWAGAGLRPTAGSRDFQESKYQVTATTTTARLARFLQTIEHALIPARIDGISITAPRPGQDNLRVEFTVSALLYAPRATTTAPQSAATRPATARGPETSRAPIGTAPGRVAATGRGTGPSTATAPTLTTQDEAKLIEELIRRRREQEERLATMPDTPPEPAATGPARTAEEIEAEMRARRQADEAAAETRMATMPAIPAPATAPARTAEEIEAEMRAKRLAEEAAAAGSQPATTTNPTTTGGVQ